MPAIDSFPKAGRPWLPRPVWKHGRGGDIGGEGFGPDDLLPAGLTVFAAGGFETVDVVEEHGIVDGSDIRSEESGGAEVEDKDRLARPGSPRGAEAVSPRG